MGQGWRDEIWLAILRRLWLKWRCCGRIGRAKIAPQGICGSGLVDLLSELLRTGRMNEMGRFEGHDIDRIIQAWQLAEPRRLTRSAVLRRAVEHLRSAVDADPAKSLLENE